MIRRSNTNVGLADVIESLGALEPGDDRVVTEVCRMLGFEWPPLMESPATTQTEEVGETPSDSINDQAGKVKQATESTSESDSTAASQVATSKSPSPSSTESPLLELVDRLKSEAEKLFADESLDEIAPVEPTDERHSAPLKHIPLFQRRWFRALISLLVGELATTRTVSIRTIENRIARLRPIDELPRETRRHMRMGVQLLLDDGEAMQPFARDQDELVRDLELLIGEENVTASFFRGDPRRGAGPGPISEWTPFVRPLANVPIVIVSDFGLSPLSPKWDTTDWNTWAWISRTARRSGCRTVSVIPVPEDRWPRQFRQLFPLAVEWDVRTTPQSVQRQLRNAAADEERILG